MFQKYISKKHLKILKFINLRRDTKKTMELKCNLFRFRLYNECCHKQQRRRVPMHIHSIVCVSRVRIPHPFAIHRSIYICIIQIYHRYSPIRFYAKAYISSTEGLFSDSLAIRLKYNIYHSFYSEYFIHRNVSTAASDSLFTYAIWQQTEKKTK